MVKTGMPGEVVRVAVDGAVEFSRIRRSIEDDLDAFRDKRAAGQERWMRISGMGMG